MVKVGIEAFTVDSKTLNKLIEEKIKENIRLVKLGDYYLGKHSILKRWYPEEWSKPNNRIVVNYCKLVADFLTSYLVGVPVKYDGSTEEMDKILKVNHDPEVMMGVLTDTNVFGFGVELFYTDEMGNLKYDNISPVESIVLLDDSIEPVLLGYLRLVPKEDVTKEGYTLYVYTDKEIITFPVSSVGHIGPAIDRSANTLGRVPIALYLNDDDMQGSFEQLIPLQDALNKIYSDSVNDFEEFVDSFLVLQGMEGTSQEDIARMKRERVLLTPPDSTAFWLTKYETGTRTKVLQDDISRELMRMGYVPDVTDITGFNVSGESMRLRLIFTEIKASNQESYARRALDQKIAIISSYLNIALEEEEENLDIEPVFTRNFMVGDPTATAEDDSGSTVEKTSEGTNEQTIAKKDTIESANPSE